MSAVAMDMGPDLRENVSMIRRNVELEVKLIDDLLDLSRVTAGKLRLQMETMDVNSAVRHVCETCRPFILEKGIQLHCNLPGATMHVNADVTRLQQVLWNLIKNAAKFIPERGDIYVNVSKTDEDLRKSREAGFSDHIVKPANGTQLERTIRRDSGIGSAHTLV
jgi:signal transduction histidine kinase